MSLSTDQLKSLVLGKGQTPEATFNELLEYSKNSNIPLEDVLIDKKLITDVELGQLTAQSLNLPFVELSKLDISDQTLATVPEEISKKRQVVVFGRDENGIRVATAGLDNSLLLEMLGKKTGAQLNVYYATTRDIKRTLAQYNVDLQKLFDKLQEEDDGRMITSVAHDPPVAKMVDTLIASAYNKEASDIHIEPTEKNVLVRFRIDGMLHDVVTLPKPLHSRLTNRIKVMSKLRTDEHLAAQDGKIRMDLPETQIDLRISILPIAEGEKVVMRLLPSEVGFDTLEDLGFRQEDLEKVKRAFSKPYGMLICTGPTGSGKTTTIYTILKYINKREVNVTTLEDPIEYRMKGTNQIQVNEKTNLTFANGLRSILRQDPNVIFVGEVRDNETAGIAVNAALTGHLVLTTLHTNNASTTLPRLFDMRVEPFLAASTVNIIIGQRLVRKICNRCKEPVTVRIEELSKTMPADIAKKMVQLAGNPLTFQAFQGKGCQICHNTGYHGRIGVYEVIEVTKALRALIANKQESQIIEEAARKEGMITMLEDGILKMLQGLTTVEEVLRVTKSGE